MKLKLIVFVFENMYFFKEYSPHLKNNEDFILGEDIIITTSNKIACLTKSIRNYKESYISTRDISGLSRTFFDVTMSKLSAKDIRRLPTVAIISMHKLKNKEKITYTRPVSKIIQKLLDDDINVNTDEWRYHATIAPEGRLFRREQFEFLPDDWVDTPAGFKE